MTQQVLPEIFANPPTPGGTVPWQYATLGTAISTTPAPGTQETWTLSGPITSGNSSLVGQGQFRFVIDNEICLDITGGGGITRTVIRGVEGSTPAAHSSGVPLYHIITGEALLGAGLQGPNTSLQSGIAGSADLATSGVSLNTANGNITLTVAAAKPVWMLNSAGILIPVYVNSQTVTLTNPGNGGANTTSLYDVYLQADGTLQILAGSSTAGNVALSTFYPLTGSVPQGKIRIATYAVFYNGTTYAWASGGGALTVGTNWIDRRSWANGASAAASGSTSGPNTATTTLTGNVIAEMSLRVESIKNLMIDFTGDFSTGTAGTRVQVEIFQDGAAASSIRQAYLATANQEEPVALSFVATPAAGSHLWTVNWASPDGATITASGTRRHLRIREIPLVANNGIV